MRRREPRLDQLTRDAIDRCRRDRPGVHVQPHTRTLGKHRGLPQLSDGPIRQPLIGNPRISESEAPARNQLTRSRSVIPSRPAPSARSGQKRGQSSGTGTGWVRIRIRRRGVRRATEPATHGRTVLFDRRGTTNSCAVVFLSTPFRDRRLECIFGAKCWPAAAAEGRPMSWFHRTTRWRIGGRLPDYEYLLQ